MARIKMTFDEVGAWGRRRGNCTVCGKVGKHERRFVHTVNPFNTNDLGHVKTFEEVKRDVMAEAAAWSQGPFTHIKCGG